MLLCSVILTKEFTVGLGDSSNSVTIITVSVTITTVLAKNYYRDSGHVVMGMCI